MVFRRNYVTTFDLDSWYDNPTEACEGHFLGFGHEFVLLKNARLDKSTRTFSIPCRGKPPRYWFYYGYQGTPYKEWLTNLQTYSPKTSLSSVKNYRPVAMVVRRNEAHNIYHTMCEYYNIFLLAKHFNYNMNQIDIILMDDRPENLMDYTWKKMFKNVWKYHSISEETTFKTLFWIPIGYESPMNFHHLMQIPYANDFHKYFIHAFGVQHSKHLDCSSIKIVFIFRHDYISHPERKELFGGKIQRKISNEDQLMTMLRTFLEPKHKVQSVILEQMSMEEQVGVFSTADILIGMHGAGLAHIWSFPSHAAVIELFPYSYKWRGAYYFQAFAKWRNLKYTSWVNPYSVNEVDKYSTYVKESELKALVSQTMDQICYKMKWRQ